MKRRIVFYFLLLGVIIANIEVYQKVEAKSIEKVINHARNVYYTTNKKLDKYSLNQEKGLYDEYWKLKDKRLKKLVIYPDNIGVSIKKYTVEYYYDKNQKLVFAFAYRKLKGKMKEYRAYYGVDGKLYRYIDSSGKIKDYENGKNILSGTNKLRYTLYNKGTYYLHLCEEDFK